MNDHKICCSISLCPRTPVSFPTDLYCWLLQRKEFIELISLQRNMKSTLCFVFFPPGALLYTLLVRWLFMANKVLHQTVMNVFGYYIGGSALWCLFEYLTKIFYWEPSNPNQSYLYLMTSPDFFDWVNIQIYRKVIWGSVPLGGALLEGVDDLPVVAELTDEAFLSTQTAAENMGAGKLDHLGQEGSQFSINHLEGGGEWGWGTKSKRGRTEERAWSKTTKTSKS